MSSINPTSTTQKPLVINVLDQDTYDTLKEISASAFAGELSDQLFLTTGDAETSSDVEGNPGEVIYCTNSGFDSDRILHDRGYICESQDDLEQTRLKGKPSSSDADEYHDVKLRWKNSTVEEDFSNLPFDKVIFEGYGEGEQISALVSSLTGSSNPTEIAIAYGAYKPGDSGWGSGIGFFLDKKSKTYGIAFEDNGVFNALSTCYLNNIPESDISILLSRIGTRLYGSFLGTTPNAQISIDLTSNVVGRQFKHNTTIYGTYRNGSTGVFNAQEFTTTDGLKWNATIGGVWYQLRRTSSRTWEFQEFGDSQWSTTTTFEPQYENLQFNQDNKEVQFTNVFSHEQFDKISALYENLLDGNPGGVGFAQTSGLMLTHNRVDPLTILSASSGGEVGVYRLDPNTGSWEPTGQYPSDVGYLDGRFYRNEATEKTFFLWNGRATSIVGDQYATVSQLSSKMDISASPFYRGLFDNWSQVPSDISGYLSDDYGNFAPLKNDYIIVLSAEQYPTDSDPQISGTWRFTYNGTWESDHKNGWKPQYRVNEGPFSASQMSAIDSGITQGLVEKFNGYETGKADTATTLSGYGITDAKIENNVITLGSTTMTVHGDYIVDADGNTISANLTGKHKSQTYVWQIHWIQYNKDYTLTGTYDSAEYYPAVPTETDKFAFELRVSEGSETAQGRNDFDLYCYRWESGEWIIDSSGTKGEIPVDGTHYQDGMWIADWTAEIIDITLATEGYVDSKIGDVATILHNM